MSSNALPEVCYDSCLSIDSLLQDKVKAPGRTADLYSFFLTPHNHKTASLLEVYISQGIQETALHTLHPLYARLFFRTMHQEHASAHEPREVAWEAQGSLAVNLQHCTPLLR